MINFIPYFYAIFLTNSLQTTLDYTHFLLSVLKFDIQSLLRRIANLGHRS